MTPKLFPVLCALLCSANASAAILQPSHDSTASVCLNTPTPTICSIANVQSTVSNGAAVVSGAFGSATSGVQMAVNSSAVSTYGTLRAGVNSSLNISSSGGGLAAAYALASFEDVLTIDFQPFTGLQGNTTLQYTLDGTINSSRGDNAFAEVSVFFGSNLDQSFFKLYSTSTPSQVFIIPKAFTFTYGQPFGIDFGLVTFNGLATPTLDGSGWTTQVGRVGSGVAAADFMNTLVLSGITVTDDAGNVVTGASITSASGTQYGPNGASNPVPEPGAFLLFGFGLTAMLSCAKKWTAARS